MTNKIFLLTCMHGPKMCILLKLCMLGCKRQATFCFFFWAKHSEMLVIVIFGETRKPCKLYFYLSWFHIDFHAWTHSGMHMEHSLRVRLREITCIVFFSRERGDLFFLALVMQHQEKKHEYIVGIYCLEALLRAWFEP
jgi:hypothetical protein